jgi:hypothetical protein
MPFDFANKPKSYNNLEDRTMDKKLVESFNQSCAIAMEKSVDFDNNTKAMKKKFYMDTLGWGFVLWLIGYLLGMILFFVAPQNMIGWAIMPIGIIITLWVLLKRIKGNSFNYYLYLAIAWTLIAIVFDYLFIVKTLKPADGYYKLDVYLYYALTFILPLAAYWRKKPI